MTGKILKDLLGVSQRMLINNQQKVDYLLESIQKITAYAQTKDDKALGEIISYIVSEYKQKFQKKTEHLLLEMKGVAKKIKEEKESNK